MLQLKNHSPLAVHVAVFPDPDGVDTLYAAIKATFDLVPTVRLAKKQQPLYTSDCYHEDPSTSSLQRPTEVHLTKPHTDVVVMGHAWTIDGRLNNQLMVRVAVAEREKSAVVFGDRVWRQGGRISSPEFFEKMPLQWERAYGGVHCIAPQGLLLAEERNPVGRGFLGRRSFDEFLNQPVPNIENPAALIQRLGDAPPPTGFAPIAPAWLTRRQCAGTYDAAWQRTRAPYLPVDFTARFFAIAIPELTFDRYLQGGEPVHLSGLSPRGPLAFSLPSLTIDVQIDIDATVHKVPANLETAAILPDEHEMTMVWRAALACDKKVLKVKQTQINVAGLEAYAARDDV